MIWFGIFVVSFVFVLIWCEVFLDAWSLVSWSWRSRRV